MTGRPCFRRRVLCWDGYTVNVSEVGWEVSRGVWGRLVFGRGVGSWRVQIDVGNFVPTCKSSDGRGRGSNGRLKFCDEIYGLRRV